MLAAARRPRGGPARSDSAVWGAERPAEPFGLHAAPAASIRCSRQVSTAGVQPASRTGSPAGRRGPFRAEFAHRRPASEQTPRKNRALLTGRIDQGGEHGRNFCEVKLRRCGKGGTTADSEQSLREQNGTRFGTGRECSVADGTVEQGPV